MISLMSTKSAIKPVPSAEYVEGEEEFDLDAEDKARLDAHLDEIADDPQFGPTPAWDEHGKLYYFNAIDESGKRILR